MKTLSTSPEGLEAAARPLPARTTSSPRLFRDVRKTISATTVTAFTLAILGVYLSPFLFMTFTSLKTQAQITLQDSPIWPATPGMFEYNGEQLELFTVPLPDGTVRDLAIVRKGRQESTFINPANPEAGEIVWQGAWRTLERPWQWAPAWSNYVEVWNLIDIPRVIGNTAFYAFTTVFGTLASCTLVAYGFARYRFPGRDLLFILLISTIFLPGAVTLIPTYTFFQRIGWVGTWLPLIVPHFFANAYNVFLLRQFFLTLPRELDESAMMDGASPLQILWSIILPQSIPALIAVGVFHIVFAWNDYFGPLIYLSTVRDNWPISVALSQFNGIYGQRPQLIQAGAMMGLIIPLIVFFLAQRFFVQGIVITGVEK
jgi:multiple sugar transport system permease protein